MMSVVMGQGETIIFSVEARDEAGNVGRIHSPPLTIDTTPPKVTGFTCNTQYPSQARSEVLHSEVLPITLILLILLY